MGQLASQFSHSARMRRGALLCACAAAALVATSLSAGSSARGSKNTDPSLAAPLRAPEVNNRHGRGSAALAVPGLRPGSRNGANSLFDIAGDVPAAADRGVSGKHGPKDSAAPPKSIFTPLAPGPSGHADVDQLLLTSTVAPPANQAHVEGGAILLTSAASRTAGRQPARAMARRATPATARAMARRAIKPTATPVTEQRQRPAERSRQRQGQRPAKRPGQRQRRRREQRQRQWPAERPGQRQRR